MEKWVRELEYDIKKLDHRIKYNKQIKFLNKTVKNLEISYACLKFISPYIITAFLSAGIFKAVGLGYPFYLDDTKVYQKEMIEYDNYGNNTTQTSYDSFDDFNSVTIYTPWRYEDNVYKRNISIYNVDNRDIEDVNSVLNGEKDIEDLVKKPTREIEEIKNEITQEELNNESIIEVRVYNENKNKYDFRKENVGKNIEASFLYCLGVMVIGAIIYGIQYELGVKINNTIYKIKRKYKKEDEDIEVLKKKLQIRKDTYDRLVK